MKKIVIPQDITAVGKDYLKSRNYGVIVGDGKTDSETLKAEIADADGILLRLAPMTAEILKAGTKLKVIGRHGVGVDNIDLGYCRDNGIIVTYTPEANSVSVAEHTIATMMAITKNIPVVDAAVREGNWAIRNQLPGMELNGKVMAIVGLGRIGRLVAQKASAAFGMKIVGYDPMLSDKEFPSGVTRVACVEEAFEVGDFVSLHLPTTAETKKMVNKKLLKKMKANAIIINCARGDLINEDDLYQALSEKAIKGAALDVFEEEPPMIYHPLFQLKNVVLTPHTASLTQESLDRMGLHAAMGIDDVLSGRKAKWVYP